MSPVDRSVARSYINDGLLVDLAFVMFLLLVVL